MTKEQENALFYVCSMIEYVARKTKNHRKTIVFALGKSGIAHQLKVASVNHALSFEQISDEWIEDYKILTGTFDSVATCKYTVPSETAIGALYQTIIMRTIKKEDIAQEIINVFSSFISDEISNFNSDLYYVNPDYITCSYKAGFLLS